MPSFWSEGKRRIHQIPSTPIVKSNRKKKRKVVLCGLIGLISVVLILTYPIAIYLMPLQGATSILSDADEPQASTKKNQGTFISSDKHGIKANTGWTRTNEITSGMPIWMEEYFLWHAKARAQMEQDHDTWKSHRFLMLQCLPGSRKCGGTADRLKPLPLMLWVAHQSQRILVIKWGRPAELEEFLLPPQGGLDWRVPQWLHQIPEFKQGPRTTNAEELQEMASNSKFIMVKARVQTHDHGAQFYNDNQKMLPQNHELTFEEVYHLVWRAMFTPSPPVAKLIEDQLRASQLAPGHYVGIHIRALYAVSERDPAMIEHWTRNAIHCASQLQPGGPFYLSSDSSHAVAVGKAYGRNRQVSVASRNGIGHLEPFHLDKAPRSAKASDFYDTFVDLYLLAMSRCVTYNMGGFGTWALFISPYANDKDNMDDNGACSMQHHEARGIHKCEWAQPTENDQSTRSMTSAAQATKEELFLPSMLAADD